MVSTWRLSLAPQLPATPAALQSDGADCAWPLDGPLRLHLRAPLSPPLPRRRRRRRSLPRSQTTPLVAGLAVGAAAYGARAALQAFTAWKAAGPRMRQFYKARAAAALLSRRFPDLSRRPPCSPAALLCGCPILQGGFQSEMNRREAALILGLRESAPEEKVRGAAQRSPHASTGGLGVLPLPGAQVGAQTAPRAFLFSSPPSPNTTRRSRRRIGAS